MRRLLGGLGLALFGVLLAVVVGELAARVLLGDGPTPEVQPPPPPGLPAVRGIVALRQPNIRAVHKGVLLETNRDGFRDRDFPYEKPPGVFRIVVAGDSFTMGQGVPGEFAYPKRLEELLNQGGNKGKFEVLNIGLSGLPIQGVYERVIYTGLRYQPDLIVYGVTLNDVKGPHYKRVMNKWSLLQQRGRYERYRDSPSYLLRLLWPRIQSLRELRDPPEQSYLAELLLNYDPEGPAWRDFENGLQQFAVLQKQREVPIVLFLHTSLFYLDRFHPFRGLYDQIEASATERGLPVIQSFPGFRGLDPREVWVSLNDLHPNRRGHQILAQSLYDGLRSLVPEIP